MKMNEVNKTGIDTKENLLLRRKIFFVFSQIAL